MNSSDYKRQMDKYDGNIKYIEGILKPLYAEKEKKETLYNEINNSGIVGKISTALTQIGDVSSKLEQSSKYMGHITIVKGRTFDQGELAGISKNMDEYAPKLTALAGEIDDKIRELEEALESINDSIGHHEGELETARRNYDTAKRNYENARGRELNAAKAGTTADSASTSNTTANQNGSGTNRLPNTNNNRINKLA